MSQSNDPTIDLDVEPNSEVLSPQMDPNHLLVLGKLAGKQILENLIDGLEAAQDFEKLKAVANRSPNVTADSFGKFAMQRLLHLKRLRQILVSESRIQTLIDRRNTASGNAYHVNNYQKKYLQPFGVTDYYIPGYLQLCSRSTVLYKQSLKRRPYFTYTKVLEALVQVCETSGVTAKLAPVQLRLAMMLWRDHFTEEEIAKSKGCSYREVRSNHDHLLMTLSREVAIESPI